MVPHRPTPGNDSLPHSVTLTIGRATAMAESTVSDALRDLLAHDLETWPTRGFAPAKSRTVRSVFRGELAGVPVFLKVFRADTLADHVRDMVRRDRGSHEASNLLRAQALGLPVVEPIAHGFACEGERLRSFVVTRAVLGAPFSFALTAAPQFAVGALLRRVHELGVLPGDLHPGNVVVDGHGEPWLLDLTSVRHGNPPSLPHRARDLAFFCHELDGGALDPRARALLTGYAAAAALPQTFERELQLATHRWRSAALPSFGRRAQRSCRHTEVPPRRRGQPRWHWHLLGDDATTRTQCEQFAAAPPAPFKSGRRGAVWLLDQLVVKQRDASKAQRLWRASYWLLFARVPTAAPVALRLHAGLGQVFTRRLANPTLAVELANGALRGAGVLAVARSLGESLGRLHAHGLGNRDLKLDNLVRDPQSGEVCMVDLDGVDRRAVGDSRGRGGDLGRLLAAFRAAGAPGEAVTLRTFLRGYLRAHRWLLQEPPVRRLLRRAEQRAGEWASAHR